MFITNSRVIKGPEALTALRKKKGDTLRAYSPRYWDVYNETEECDLRVALNTFKIGLSKDENGIYNALTRQPLTTFDELLLRVNEYARVEDDDVVDQESAVGKGKTSNAGGGNNGKFDKSKRKRKEDYNIVSPDGYKGINIVFNKLIHKIMFDI